MIRLIFDYKLLLRQNKSRGPRTFILHVLTVRAKVQSEIEYDRIDLVGLDRRSQNSNSFNSSTNIQYKAIFDNMIHFKVQSDYLCFMFYVLYSMTSVV